jgi:hypothetical protein
MVGSLAMIAITGLTLIWMTARSREDPASPDHRVAADGGVPSV